MFLHLFLFLMNLVRQNYNFPTVSLQPMIIIICKIIDSKLHRAIKNHKIKSYNFIHRKIKMYSIFYRIKIYNNYGHCYIFSILYYIKICRLFFKVDGVFLNISETVSDNLPVLSLVKFSIKI